MSYWQISVSSDSIMMCRALYILTNFCTHRYHTSMSIHRYVHTYSGMNETGWQGGQSILTVCTYTNEKLKSERL
jgi:hypothetical protein